MITHYDLFAGIGGFSLALEEVFKDETIRHIFCEWESFPTSVLRRHWPDGEFYGDIAELVAHTESQRPSESGATRNGRRGPADKGFTIVTGGFPCQPFSHAGRRRGTADDRYQWPNMFQVIRNTKPEWVIAENVRGLVTWNDGLVLETVCADLEAEGYEVQPFIIPAVAVGAPHRRDRVWIIAHRDGRQADAERQEPGGSGGQTGQSLDAGDEAPRPADGTDGDDQYERRGAAAGPRSGAFADAGRRHGPGEPQSGERQAEAGSRHDRQPEQPAADVRAWPDWSRSWQEVAFATCDDAVDDGLPRLVDGVPQSYSKWRQNSLKAYGNAIVPEVAMNIMQAVKESL